MKHAVCTIAWIVWLLQPTVWADERVDFARDIRPILADACFQCHGPDDNTREADLRLDTREGLFGDLGGHAAFVPDQPDQSEVIRRIVADDSDLRMPPMDATRKLTAQQIELLRRWVVEGAVWRQHWSLEKPQRPRLPPVQESGWPRNAIDYFVLARLERAAWSPSRPASNETLIRRVTLDLTGLPPTPREVDAFLAETSPDAYEQLVDRLLASPRYGERMVWNWLDAARYADSNGYQGDPERTMWPWRDWVVEAMNANLPFDQFTLDQIAGDLLPAGTLEQQIATGFNRNHMYNGEGGRIPEETRVENVMDRVETTATVWLGLTMTCARCHDHKYDALTMRDYYGMFAFFNQSSEEGGRRSGQIAPVVSVPTPESRERAQSLRQQTDDVAQKLVEAEAKLFAPPVLESSSFSPEIKELLRKRPDRRSSEQLKRLIDFAGQAGDQKKGPDGENKTIIAEDSGYARLLERLRQLIDGRAKLSASLPRVMVMDDSKPRDTFVLVRGTYNKPAQRVTADVPASLPALPPDVPRDRLALGRWLVSPENPLTPRVIVNRYWQLFFGEGLVRTPEDFGTQGQPPTHPELLDWLATEFVDSGWDVKHIQKLMVMSATYRQSSKRQAQAPDSGTRDPDNRLLSRGPRTRLPSWMIRDQALFSSGLLVERVGGPSVRPYQPAGIWDEATFGKKKYVQDQGAKLYRRSVYTFWRRIVGPTLFFDVANRQTCTVKMTRTNTPLHALLTLNDTTYVEAARLLAQRVMQQERDTVRRIELAFRLVATRRPTERERLILLSRLTTLREQFAADESAAHQLLEAGESSRAQSLDTIEYAAYTALCTLIFNLDESMTKQ